jgi:hypothetical protein
MGKLTIRTGFVWKKDFGYLLACDPATEEDSPHAKLLAWNQGKFSETWVKFNAHSICRILSPERGVVVVAADGHYGVFHRAVHVGSIFRESQPPPQGTRYASLRAVAEIDGHAYAVGLRGMAYRLDKIDEWTRIDDGLPESFNVEAIDGFNAAEMYAVGSKGAMWQHNGQTWTRRDLPTNANLTTIKCAGDGQVYVGGHAGILIRGRDSIWEIIDQDDVEDDIWDLEWYQDAVFVSTLSGAYRLAGSTLESLHFGDEKPKSFYQLSARDGVLWSIGETDVLSFDGASWSRIF